MQPSEYYHERVLALLPSDGAFTAHSADEAKAVKKEIVLIQKRLRQLKSEINLDIKTVRADYQAQAQKTQSRGTLLGILTGKRRFASRLGAIDRQRAADNRNDTIAPYEAVKGLIDQLLVQLDGGKLQIDEALRSGNFD